MMSCWITYLYLSKNFPTFQSEFDESLKNSEECPLMIPKYFANVQPKAGFDKKQITYHKKPVQTKEQCVQLCCNLKDCNIVFMYKENSQLTCFHVSYYNINILSYLRDTSILGEVRNVEISRVTQQLLCSKSHDFLAVFALAHSKINQIA